MPKDGTDYSQAFSASIRATEGRARPTKRKNAPFKAFFRIVVGVVFGVITTAALLPALAAFLNTGTNDAMPPTVTVIVIVATAVFAYFAPSIRRAFGRGFLISGAAILALPISSFLLAGRAAQEVVSATAANDQIAASIGAGAGALLVTGVATFFGLIVGGIFCLVGLILSLGGRREVVVVEVARP